MVKDSVGVPSSPTVYWHESGGNHVSHHPNVQLEGLDDALVKWMHVDVVNLFPFEVYPIQGDGG